MYARFFTNQNTSSKGAIYSDANFSFNENMLGDRLSIYCDDCRFLFLYETGGKSEQKLFKVANLMEADKLWRKINKDLQIAGYSLVGLISGKDMVEREAEIEKLMDMVEKKDGISKYKSPNKYKNVDKSDLREQYFSLANNELPASLAIGFIKAIEKFKKKRSDYHEICCVVDVEKPALMFAFGNECEDAEDEAIFHKHRCDKIFTKCVEMVDAIDTLNIGQENCHWLTDAIMIAEKQGAFSDINVEIFGDYMYGEYEMDVIFSPKQ